jgi:hypothetical protein
MNEQEARSLAAQIEVEPGWNAEVRHNLWSDEWYVWAWQGDAADDDENGYALHYPSDWHRLHRGLAEEEQP